MSNLFPLASILLVSHNQESLIKEAFDSLLSQTYSNLEIIVADDFSTDSTKSILKNIATAYKGDIKIIFHEVNRNLGICENVNRAIRLCSGEIIFLAAGDDISLPNRCEKVVDRWLKLNKKPDLIATDAYDLSFDGDIMGVKKICPLERVKSVQDWISSPPYFFGCTFALTQRLINKFPAINPEMLAEDHVLLFRAILSGGANTLSEPLVMHRRGGVTRRNILELADKVEKLKIGYLDKYRFINQILEDAKDHPDFYKLFEHYKVELKECELAIQLFGLNRMVEKILMCIKHEGPSIFFRFKILTYSTFPWLLLPIFKAKLLLKIINLRE